ncbi:hypothetical protein AB0L40_12345 [Patulibacter sp. NPDC049589]|uniref:hypothetical protein n=1 Tax=Patulibacter sp. NPDC049589 TaxID=3154731 RepID=UPI00344124A1
MHPSVRPWLLAAAASAVLVLAGCGGDDDAPSASAPSGSTPTTAAKDAAGSGAPDAAAIAETVKFTGGKAGKADPSLSPVVVGVVNQQGGAPAFPEYLETAKVAAKLVNEQLGGVGGHPLKLETCIVQSEEDGQRCASEFLTKKLSVAIWTIGVVGNQSFYKTVAGKFPVLNSSNATGADSTTPHVYTLDAGSGGILKGMVGLSTASKPKTLAIVSDDSDAGKYLGGQVLVPTFKKLGVNAKAAFYPVAGTQPEMVSAIQASGAPTADSVLFLGPTPSVCLSGYKAMKQLGVQAPVTGTSVCAGDDFVAGTDDGAGVTNWTFAGLARNARITDDPQATAFRDVMDAYGKGDLAAAGHVLKTFGDVLAITRWATEIGADEVTAAAYEKAIAAFRGPAFAVPGALQCGWDRAAIGVCGKTVPVSAFRDGAWKSLPDIPVGG